MKEIKAFNKDDCRLSVEDHDGKIIIYRHSFRGNVHNRVETYEKISQDGRSTLTPLDTATAICILNRVWGNMPYAEAFLFEDVIGDPQAIDMTKTEMEHRFTSTGQKFWRHRSQMEAYRAGQGNTIISTHVSPEGACNLKCPYCSVTHRDTHSRIDLGVVMKYVTDLKGRGLKAVILTGGGEPTAYPEFNDLICWLKAQDLSVALITNGTLTHKVTPKAWSAFSWVRVSLNQFDGWEERINLPTEHLSSGCVVGCSMVYTTEHEATKEQVKTRQELLQKAARVADKLKATYVRLLPNCLLQQRALLVQHRALDHDIRELNDPRFFHQHKVHGAPKCNHCHQSHFRPYLSEERFHGNNLPGTVYPCDSVVLNEAYTRFALPYQVCHASQVLDFLDGKIKMQFDPQEKCKGCVFTDNVNMLDDWKSSGVDRFSEFPQPLTHEEFV